jgi:hypothetical protein
MITGGAVVFALLIVAIGIAVLIGGVWFVGRATVDLAKGNSDQTFWRALKVFVFFSFLTGLVVVYVYALCVDGLVNGVHCLFYGSSTFNSLTFWLPFTVQMLALLVLIPAWRSRWRDRGEDPRTKSKTKRKPSD